MKNYTFAKLLVICCITFSAATLTAAQDGGQTRSITSDDFSSQRPAAALGASSKISAAARKRKAAKATYKFVRKGSPNRWSAKAKAATKPAANVPTKVSEIGVTIWKLRPSLKADVGFKLPVKVSGAIQMWTAERVSTDTMFRAGDRVRLAVESPVSGYLYVLNSEIGTDGSLGHPHLIFPGSGNQDNTIMPGMLVDIPDQREDLPYFVMSPKKENYAGEAIAIVVSPVQLRIKVASNGKVEDVENLDEIIPYAEAEVFTRTDTKDKIYSNTESQSACGAKSRQLEREKTAAQPCGAASRQLTREEPLPQTIYRIKTTTGRPAVALIELKTGN